MSHRVLIVEDDAAVRARLADLLDESGHTVTGQASDMASALELAGKSKTDVAIVDVLLADGETGLLTAEALAARFGVKTVFLTGNSGYLVRAMSMEPAPLGYVSKPFSDEELLAPLG